MDSTQQFLHPLESNRPAALMALARRLIEQLLMLQREQRALAIRLQRDRHLRFTLGRRMPGPAEDEAPVRHHLAVDAADLIIFACRGEAEAEASADPHIRLGLQRVRARVRPAEPAHYFLRVGPGGKDLFGRRVDATLKYEARSRDGFGDVGCCRHVSSSTKAVRRSILSDQKRS